MKIPLGLSRFMYNTAIPINKDYPVFSEVSLFKSPASQNDYIMASCSYQMLKASRTDRFIIYCYSLGPFFRI